MPDKAGFLIILILAMVNSAYSGVPFLFQDTSGTYSFAKWDENPIKIEINPSTSSSLSNSDVLNEFATAFDTWQNVGSSSVSFNRITTFTTPVNPGGQPDFRNAVEFSSTFSYPPGVIGVTNVTVDAGDQKIVDADMFYNKGVYQFITQAQGPSDINARRIVLSAVATHEVGHLLGFDHSPMKAQNIDIFSLPESTMFPFFSDSQSTLEQDDISILSFTYPSGSNTYTGIIQGIVLDGERPGDRVAGAHVIAWDTVTNPNKFISTVSGVTATGVNLDSYYRLTGLPPGNWQVMIQPFPTESNGVALNIEENFNFLKNINPGVKATYLAKKRDFQQEFYHSTAESRFETGLGLQTATFLTITTNTGSIRADFETNLPTSGLNLINSDLTFDQSILYANGTTSTILRFTPKDLNGNLIEANLSSRFRFSITTGSFASNTTVLITTPAFVNDGSFSYTSTVFSPDLSGTSNQLTAQANVSFDGSNVFLNPKEIKFEKPHPSLTTIQFIPDIEKFNADGLTQQKTSVFGDGNAKATWRITPRFSDNSIIPVNMDLNSAVSSMSPEVNENTITTFPIVSVGNNQYQTTMTRSEAGTVRPVFILDGVPMAEQEEIQFSGISTTQTGLRLNASMVHIKHPQIPTTPTVTLFIEPAFEDGSLIPSPIQTSNFNIIFRQNGTTVGLTRSNLEGPLRDVSNNPYYATTIESITSITSVSVEVQILNQRIEKDLTIQFAVSDPTKSEIRAVPQYILAGSNQESRLEYIPRFSDGSLINSDISKLVNLFTTSGTLKNSSGEQTGIATPAIHPSYESSAVLTAALLPSAAPNVANVRATVQAQGIQNVSDTEAVNFVLGNPNLLDIQINPNIIAADGISITTIVVRPLFPDGAFIGKEFPESSLTASISEGEFLKKARDPLNPTRFKLFPAGTQNISFFNRVQEDPLADGVYELSVRSANFTTIAQVSFYVDNVLSLSSRTISYSVVGSASPVRTEVRVAQPILYADGQSRTRIDIFPKAANGEAISLPTTSTIIVRSNTGSIVGSIIRNPDNSFTQYIQSDLSSVKRTAFVTVLIDNITMTPQEPVKVEFIDLDVSRITANLDFPDNGLIDGFDISILAQAIRNRICRNGLGDCTLDFNNDGNVDLNDMEVLKDAYGKTTP